MVINTTRILNLNFFAKPLSTYRFLDVKM